MATFLVNSRAAFVTEIYLYILLPKKQDTKIDTPLTEATGPICRIPLIGLTLHVLAFSARAPVSVVGTAN